MTIALNSLSFYSYIVLLTVYFLPEILNPLVMVEGGIFIFQEIFRYAITKVKSTERILKKFIESLLTMAGQRRKFFFSRTSKTPVSLLQEYIIFKK